MLLQCFHKWPQYTTKYRAVFEVPGSFQLLRMLAVDEEVRNFYPSVGELDAWSGFTTGERWVHTTGVSTTHDVRKASNVEGGP